jgi:2-polyprenyl-3-methyl-5-hydroxy-6-metoxy-1,4-benzoquinol methylase
LSESARPEYWNALYRDHPEHVMIEDAFLDAETAHLRPGAALDLGCGVGRNAIKLAGRGWTVVGVDWAEHAVRLARRAASDLGLDVEFVVADIAHWSPSRRFDLVVCTYALVGGDTTRSVLRTASSALAMDGTLIVTEWDRSMREVSCFADNELTTPDEIAAELGDLVIEKAEVRRIRAFTTPADPRSRDGGFANAVLVRARRVR